MAELIKIRTGFLKMTENKLNASLVVANICMSHVIYHIKNKLMQSSIISDLHCINTAVRGDI